MSKRPTDKPLLSIVIPLYDEAYHLRTVLSAIQKVLQSLNESYELILVDDGSSDNTWAILEEEAKQFSLLRAVKLSRNFGKEAALCAGLEMARGEAVIVMDGDLQHPPELITEMVRLWRESQVDVVEAVKVSRGQELIISKIRARVFYYVLKKLSGYDIDNASDYKLINRKVVNAWLTMGERKLFFRGMIAWLGFKRVQLPFEVQERSGGRSRWTTFQLVRLALTAVTSFSSLPLQFVTVFGLIFLVFSIILGGQTLFLKIVGSAVSGFTTVIILLLIIGSFLMISLGIIGDYIGKIYEEVKGRPRYIVAQRIDETIEEECHD